VRDPETKPKKHVVTLDGDDDDPHWDALSYGKGVDPLAYVTRRDPDSGDLDDDGQMHD
jgi:hypothetical protein